MRVLILVACAACSFHPPTAGDAGGGPDGDRDGDGVTDRVDLCPDVADPLQRDHDADELGDACDRCPHVMDPDDPDQDLDGVGDGCDPAPAMPGDRRVLWIGFYPEDADQLGDSMRWTRLGSWTVVDGWVRGVSEDITDLGVLRSTLVVQRATASSRIRFDDTSAGNTAAGLLTGLRLNGLSVRQFYQCVLFKNGTRIGARSFIDGDVRDDEYTAWTGAAVTDGLVVDVRARFAGSAFDCNFASPPTTVQSNPGPTNGNPELILQDATVSFDYFFVVEQGS